MQKGRNEKKRGIELSLATQLLHLEPEGVEAMIVSRSSESALVASAIATVNKTSACRFSHIA